MPAIKKNLVMRKCDRTDIEIASQSFIIFLILALEKKYPWVQRKKHVRY